MVLGNESFDERDDIAMVGWYKGGRFDGGGDEGVLDNLFLQEKSCIVGKDDRKFTGDVKRAGKSIFWPTTYNML